MTGPEVFLHAANGGLQEKCKSAFGISLNLFRRRRRAAMRLFLTMAAVSKALQSSLRKQFESRYFFMVFRSLLSSDLACKQQAIAWPCIRWPQTPPKLGQTKVLDNPAYAAYRLCHGTARPVHQCPTLSYR